MKRIFSLSLLSLLTATSVLAETAPTVSGLMSLGVSYGNTGAGGENFDTNGFNVNADLDINVGENMTIGVMFAHIENTIQIAYDPTLETTRWGIEPTYHYANNAYTGLYYQDFTLGVEGIGIGINSFGVFGGFEATNYSVEVYAGQSQTGGIYGENVSLEATNFGVSGSVKVSNQLEMFGHYSMGDVGTNIFDGPEIGTNTSTSLGFDYAASKTLSVFGALASFNMDMFGGADPINQATLGLGADLTAMGVDLPGMLTAEWTHTDYGSNYGSSDFNSDVLAIGWTLNFGGAEAKSQNCVVNNARGQNRAPLAGAFECINLGGGLG